MVLVYTEFSKNANFVHIEENTALVSFITIQIAVHQFGKSSH